MPAQQKTPRVVSEISTQEDSAAMQLLLARRVSLQLKNVALDRAIQKAAEAASVQVMFSSKSIEQYSKPITADLSNVSLKEAFEHILAGTNLQVVPNTKTTLVLRESKVRGTVTNHSSAGKSQATGRIVGQVVDSSTGKGVTGATVSILGTKLGALTQENGVFHIVDIPVGSHKLSIRILGYESRTVEIAVDSGKTAEVRIILHPAMRTLSEVVTTAIGQQRRVEIPNDIVKIDPQKIMERAPVRTLTDLLEAAQVPGVLVQRSNGDPGAPSRVRIRGIKTITGNKDPVVVVDGNFIDATVGTPSGIDDIDPATIESVEIVRGPSASALYGQNAANGVIVITTKKGHAGPTRWTAMYDRNWGQTYGQIPAVYRGLGYASIGDDYGWCPITNVIAGTCLQDSVVIYDPNNPLLGGEGTETTNRVVLSVDGGTAMTTYAITGTSEQTTGVRQMRPIDQIRYRLLGLPVADKFERPKTLNRRSINVGLSMLPRASLALRLSLIGTQTDLTDNQMAMQRIGVNRDIAEYGLDSVIPNAGIIGLKESPSRSSNITLGGSLNWTAPRAWFVGGNVGLSRNMDATSTFTRNVNCVSGCTDTTGSRSESDRGGTVMTARMNVRKQLSLGALSRFLDLQPSFGVDFQKSENRTLGLSVGEIPAGERSTRGGTTQQIQYASNSIASAGSYATVTIGILKRLYFDLGTRQDVGSALAKSVGGLRYPKLGGSWLVSDESFWRASPLKSLFSTFRLRSALGYAAIQPEAGDIRGTYRSIGQQLAGAVQMVTVGNPSLKPERAMEVEVGFDADVLGDWMNVVANYSHTETQNAIIVRTLPPSAGVWAFLGASNVRKENLGRVRNRDVEVTTQIRPITTKTARLELSYTATLRENVVTKLGHITPFSNDDVGRIQEGYPIAGVWVRRVLGYRDANGDGLLALSEVVASDSSVYVGWSQPRYEAGYGITLTLLGGLTFDTRFSTKSRYVTQYTRKNKYGLEDVNAPLEVQADELTASMNSNRSIADLRWNSASVTYHLPQRLLRGMKLRSLAVNLRGSNLGLWTNYVGRDPSVNSNLLTSEIATENGNEIPTPRLFNLSFTLGL